MAVSRAVRTGAISSGPLGERLVHHLGRRTGPCIASVVYVALGLAYVFRWGSVVRHIPSLWISPVDLSDIFRASSAIAHGHFGAIYQAKSTVLSFPGILFLLAPVGAFSGHFHTVFAEITRNHHLVTQPTYVLSHTSQILNTGTITSGAGQANEYAVQPQWFVFLAPYVIVLSCVALFACDALGEQLQVPRSRRALLNLVEAVMLWPVIVIWGHPEDAVAVGLAVYALVCATDKRFTWAGWLFGGALAVQPLVVVMFPLLLVMGGKGRAARLVVQGLLPAAAVTIGPLASDLHDTVHNVVTQPAFPDINGTHQTPWTFLAPKLGGEGVDTTVGGGPLRALTLALAVGMVWWARRWRSKPEMLAWAAAAVLALRVYTESVMTAYYVWPALAVGMVVGARGSRPRFGIAVVVGIVTTVVAQWHLGVFPWWSLDVAGVTGVLIAAAHPEPLSERPSPATAVRPRVGTGSTKRKGKPSRTKRARAAGR
jgi:hypothetical protein